MASLDIRVTSFNSAKISSKRKLDSTAHLETFKQQVKPKQRLLLANKIQSKALNNDIFILSKRTIAQPIGGTKGILLYQQIEGNKLFTNDTELVNRFHFKI